MRLFSHHKFSYHKLLGILISISLPLSLPSYAQDTSHSNASSLASLFGKTSQQKFLPVNQAFKVDVSQNGQELIAKFTITPKHYIYQDRIAAQLPEGVSASDWQFSVAPTMVDDPEFGRVAVFNQDVIAKAVISTQKDLNHAPISVKWQGCAEAGLCYPPEVTKGTLTLKHAIQASTKAETKKPETKETAKVAEPQTASKLPSQIIPANTTNSGNDIAISRDNNQIANLEDKASSVNGMPPALPVSRESNQEMDGESSNQNNQENDLIAQNTDLQNPSQNNDGGQSGISVLPADGEQTQIQPNEQNTQSATDISSNSNLVNHTLPQDSDPFGIHKNPLLALMLLFLAGLLLAFTPCVYPMIPIVANIVARQKNTNSVKGFMLSTSYGVGVATAYGAIGALVAGLGRAVGILGYLQNHYILGGFAIVFVVLALAMFDVIKLSLPSAISDKLSQKSQLADGKLGSIGGSFVVGALSALVVSPCVSLPMAGALTAVSTSGSIVLGFFALFVFGVGLSLPLMMLGAVQGKFMPKAGQWMQEVKTFCGLLLLAVSISLIERIIHSSFVLALWAFWFAMLCVWFYRQKVLPALALSIISGVWTLCLMIGVATGQSDSWQPLGKLTETTAMTNNAFESKNSDITVTNLAQLDEILSKNDKVLVDITADWCIECKIMEKTLFTNRPDKLADFQVVKVDISQNTSDSKAVLARYQLFGPPALLLYQKGELKNVLLGEVKRADFEQALSQL